ncbi:calcineurin-like phosphoesterase family protein [Pseudopedobacter sp.]|uniref:calcineurin-like phosphoesterase family protein n=1 Tax=Pseudopedobacter sp. TaxID=1936787 RepID=UPI0033418329
MQRRSFIQSFGILAGGMAVSLKSKAFTNLKHNNKISGTVTSNGKPLKNVVISDGFSVVATNTKGRYSIQLTDKSEFIILSTPSGYDFTVDNGNLAKQYENLGSRNEYHFKLKKLKKNDTKHHFIVWADPQVRTKADVKQMLETSVPDVQNLVKGMGEDILVHGITVGDIVWDNHKLIPDYIEAVKRMGIPFFQALGNHDMDYRQGGDDTSDRSFKLNYGPTYYSFNRGKAHYVVLDDVRYLGTERDYDGYIVEQQLNWLRKDLEYVPKDYLIVIGLHIPVHNSVKNRDELYSILEGRKVHVMSGHTHYNNNYEKYGVYEHVHGTVCGAWWSGPLCGDGTPRGYGVYEVNGNDLTWYYKSTGFDAHHQYSYDIQELTAQKRLIVNVWNWDKEWKVEWWGNDKFMGEMEQTKGFDPLTVRLYKGDKLPEIRSWVEPKRTDHLFMAHLDPEVTNLKIKITDRFGKVYQGIHKI